MSDLLFCVVAVMAVAGVCLTAIIFWFHIDCPWRGG